MLEKLDAVSSRYEELCAKSEQPDFYADPKAASKLLREQKRLEPIVTAYRSFCKAKKEAEEAFISSRKRIIKRHCAKIPS